MVAKWSCLDHRARPNGFDISPIRIDGWRNRTSIPSARTRFATSGKSSRCCAKSFNERDSEHEETDLSKKYRCEIQGESIIDEDPDPNKNRRLAWGKMCKHNHDNPKGLSPSDLDFYMKIFPDVKPKRFEKFRITNPIFGGER